MLYHIQYCCSSESSPGGGYLYLCNTTGVGKTGTEPNLRPTPRHSFPGYATRTPTSGVGATRSRKKCSAFRSLCCFAVVCRLTQPAHPPLATPNPGPLCRHPYRLHRKPVRASPWPSRSCGSHRYQGGGQSSLKGRRPLLMILARVNACDMSCNRPHLFFCRKTAARFRIARALKQREDDRDTARRKLSAGSWREARRQVRAGLIVDGNSVKTSYTKSWLAALVACLTW